MIDVSRRRDKTKILLKTPFNQSVNQSINKKYGKYKRLEFDIVQFAQLLVADRQKIISKLG